MEGVPGSEDAPRWMNNINWESAGAFRVSITAISLGILKADFSMNRSDGSQWRPLVSVELVT
jgi:hypothetical protein